MRCYRKQNSKVNVEALFEWNTNTGWCIIKCKGIQEVSLPKVVVLGLTQVSLFTDPVPLSFYDTDLMVDQVNRILLSHQKNRGGGKAGSYLASSITAIN